MYLRIPSRVDMGGGALLAVQDTELAHTSLLKGAYAPKNNRPAGIFPGRPRYFHACQNIFWLVGLCRHSANSRNSQRKMSCGRSNVHGLVGFAFGEIANVFGSVDQTVSRV